MGKNQSASGLTNVIQYNNNGITFVSGSTTLMSISSSGVVTTTNIISGSNALTASNSLTASSADNFFVRQNITGSNVLATGNITAQTLVVQTVTSSIVYSSGSNTFGNLPSNVQQFTGSLRVTGSGNHFIVGGSVGIGTTSPSYILDVSGSGARVRNSGGSADFLLDRATTSAGATYQYLTNGSLRWYTGLRGLINDNFYIFNNGTSTNTLVLDASTNAATFASSVTGTIFDASSNVYRFSGNNALSLVSLNAQNVVKINAAGYWGSQMVGSNDQGILVNNSGFVGIHNNGPSYRLSVSSGNGTFIQYGDNGYLGHYIDAAYLMGGGQFNSAGTWTARSTTAVAIGVNETGGSIGFFTNTGLTSGNTYSPTERMRVTNDGYLRLASKGIQFNGDTADANSLDDYEEGSFTPTSLSSDFSSITPVFGRYIKIGSQVTINCRWTVTPGGTGKKYLVFNLPFAFVDNGNISFTATVSNYNEGLSSNSSNVGTSVRNSSSSTTQQYVEAVYISTTANSTLLLSMTYFTFF